MAEAQQQLVPNPYGISARMGGILSAILPPSAGGDEDAAEPVASGPAKIDLATAENWLIREEILPICKDAIEQNLTVENFSYPAGFGGEPPLLEAVASFFNTYFHPSIPVTSNHVVTTPGAGTCLDSLLYTLCDSGDSVIVPGPCWNGFDPYFKLHPNVDIVVANTPTLRDTLTMALLPALEAAYSAAPNPSRIKALVMTNPHNPLSQCYPAAVLRQCMSFCHDRNLHFISDEVYALSVFANSSLEPLTPFVSALSLLETLSKAEGKDKTDVNDHYPPKSIDPSRVHVLWTASKDFGLSGIRMACLISQSNRPLLAGIALSSFRQTSSLSTVFLATLLLSPELPALIKLSSTRLAHSYEILTTALRKWDVEYIPTSTGLFLFAKLAKGASTWEDEEAMVKKLGDLGVIVTPGRVYRGSETDKGWARMTFSVPESVLREALMRMEGFFNP